jgi:hypothetical protein
MLWRAQGWQGNAAPPTLPRMHDVWTLADAAAFRCSLEQVGCVRPVDVSPLTGDIREQASAYAPRMLRELARLAGGEGMTAVRAAMAVLQLASTPAPAAPPGTGAQPLPDWVDEGQRLRYQDGNGLHLPSTVDNTHLSAANVLEWGEKHALPQDRGGAGSAAVGGPISSARSAAQIPLENPLHSPATENTDHESEPWRTGTGA